MDIKFRTSSNDPDYERIEGLREARSRKYKGKILIIVGIITIPLWGIGLIFILRGVVLRINGGHLQEKYKQ